MSDKAPIVLGSRTRLQRLHDAKFLTGWVSDVSPTANGLTIRLNTPSPMAVGEDLLVSVNGTVNDLTFKATIIAIQDDSIVANIIGEKTLSPPSEPVRIAVDNYTSVLRHKNQDLSATVVDISLSGIGIILGSRIDKGEPVTVDVHTPSGDVALSGEVRYCRETTRGSGVFRVGVLLDLKDRIERAKWHNKFNSLTVCVS